MSMLNPAGLNPDARVLRTRPPVSRRSPLVVLRFEGNGFLYRMVRLLTGSLVRVAQGRAPMSWLEDLLERRSPGKSTYAAPADGLYLVRVLY